MNKSELINFVAEDAKMTKVDAKKAIDAFVKGVEKSLKKGEKVTIVSFGTWKVVKKAARVGINPRTKAKLKIPAKTVVKFSPGKGLKF